MRTSTLRLHATVLLKFLFFILCRSQITRNQGVDSIESRGRLRFNFDTGFFDTGTPYSRQWRDSRGRFQNRYGWGAVLSESPHGFLQRPATTGYRNLARTPKPQPSIYPEPYLPKTRPFNKPQNFEDVAQDEGNYRNALEDFAGPGGAFRPGGFVGLPGNRLAVSVGPSIKLRNLRKDAEDKGNYRNALSDFPGPGGAFRPGGFVGLPGNRLAVGAGPPIKPRNLRDDAEDKNNYHYAFGDFTGLGAAVRSRGFVGLHRNMISLGFRPFIEPGKVHNDSEEKWNYRNSLGGFAGPGTASRSGGFGGLPGKRLASVQPRDLQNDAEDKANYRNVLGNFAGQGATFRSGNLVGLPGNRIALGVGRISVSAVRPAAVSVPTAKRRLPFFRNSGRWSSR